MENIVQWILDHLIDILFEFGDHFIWVMWHVLIEILNGIDDLLSSFNSFDGF